MCSLDTIEDSSGIFDEVVDLNIQSVVCMQNGKHQEAIRILKQGLHSLRLLFDDCHSSYGSEYPGDLLTNQSKTIDTPMVRRQVEPDCGRVLFSVGLHDNVVSSTNTDDGVLELFSRTLHLSAGSEKVLSAEICYSLQLGVVIYNLALAHHLTGSLQRALDLYRMAHAAFSQHAYAWEESKPFLRLGLLAAANNMGHLLSVLRAFRDVAACSDEIGRLLSPYSGNLQKLLLTREERNIFLQNMCFAETYCGFIASPAA